MANYSNVIVVSRVSSLVTGLNTVVRCEKEAPIDWKIRTTAMAVSVKKLAIIDRHIKGRFRTPRMRLHTPPRKKLISALTGRINSYRMIRIPLTQRNIYVIGKKHLSI